MTTKTKHRLFPSAEEDASAVALCEASPQTESADEACRIIADFCSKEHTDGGTSQPRRHLTTMKHHALVFFRGPD